MVLENTWGWLQNRPGVPFSQMLTDDGTKTGDCNITGDYSVTPQDFYIQPPPGVIYFLHGLKVNYTLPPSPDREDYGEINDGLTNGLQFIRKRGLTETILNPRGPIKNNQDLVIAGGVLQPTGLNGSILLYVMSFDYHKDFGQPEPIHGDREESYIVRANDDFNGQNVHCVLVEGVRFAITRSQQE